MQGERKLTMKTLNRRDFGGAFGLALAAAMLLPATTAHAEDMEVHIDNFVFQPAELKIKVGTTVTWTNRDDIPHTGCRPANSGPRPWTLTTSFRSPSPMRATTNIFVLCTRT